MPPTRCCARSASRRAGPRSSRCRSPRDSSGSTSGCRATARRSSSMSEIRLAASIEGPDGAPVVILANPIGTTRAIWEAQARVLRRDFRLLRFELRGHGTPGARSEAPPGPYSIAELGTDVLGLMREHGITSAAYCGISIGGVIGLWLPPPAPAPPPSLLGRRPPTPPHP